ncbi:MAG: flagellar motor switch protein FliG [Gammaproteobacteria bacterium]|nr:flagellar motor switch protein FliG [Gammaproteobacteria bacterium]
MADDNAPENKAPKPMPTAAKKSKTVEPIERAAILLLSVGTEDAAEVLKHMGPKEVQRLGMAMARMENVERESVEGVLTEFLDVVRTQTSLGMGSDSYIKNMLVTALGEDKAGNLIDRILDGGSTTGLDTLKWMEARAVCEIIRYEHPQIQSIVIAYLDPDQAAEVLGLLDERVRIDVMMRIASLDAVQPLALQELNNILEKQFSTSTGASSANMGGSKVTAEIMNFLDSAVESELMDGIREIDDDLAMEIQELMFIFDNLSDVDDRGIQALLREVSSESLILALKGADEDLKEKIFKNMSKRAAELLRDDLEAKGPVKLSEVEGAQKEILSIARRMADAGEIALGSKGGEEML